MVPCAHKAKKEGKDSRIPGGRRSVYEYGPQPLLEEGSDYCNKTCIIPAGHPPSGRDQSKPIGTATPPAGCWHPPCNAAQGSRLCKQATPLPWHGIPSSARPWTGPHTAAEVPAGALAGARTVHPPAPAPSRPPTPTHPLTAVCPPHANRAGWASHPSSPLPRPPPNTPPTNPVHPLGTCAVAATAAAAAPRDRAVLCRAHAVPRTLMGAPSTLYTTACGLPMLTHVTL